MNVQLFSAWPNAQDLVCHAAPACCRMARTAVLIDGCYRKNRMLQVMQ
jgi:hypothetical protein